VYSVAPILYRLLAILQNVYWEPKFYIFMGKLAIRLWNYVLKGKKFEQSCISDQLSVSADIFDPLSVIGISAKFHIGASLVAYMWDTTVSNLWYIVAALLMA